LPIGRVGSLLMKVGRQVLIPCRPAKVPARRTKVLMVALLS